MRKLLAILLLLAMPSSAQWGGPMGGGGRPGAITGGGLLPGVGGDQLWVRAGPVKPTLDFDFAKNKNLTDAVSKQDPVTFSRASSGTYVGSDGLLKRALVNQALYSEQFDNAAWTKSGVTVLANQIASPDGKQTADLMLETDPIVNHWMYNSSPISVTAGETYNVSAFVKYAGRQWVKLSTDGSSDVGAYFDIQNGVVGTSDAGIFGASIQSVANGWFKISINRTSTANTSWHIIANTALSNGGSKIFDGDTSKGVYLWGIQRVTGTDPGPYIRTTSAVGGEPRFDHDPVTGESLGLLVEEARTNFEDYSDMSSGTTLVGSVTLSPNNAVGPDGATSAATLKTNNATSQQGFSTVQSSSGSTNHTFSIFAKANGIDHIQLIASSAVFGIDVWGNFDIANGVAGTMGAAVINHGVENFGNGWYRVFITGLANGSAGNGGPYMVDSVSTTRGGNVTGDGTSGVLLFGYQFEAGAFPTSYIPTSGSAATRAADVAAVQDADFSTTNLLAYSESFDVGWTNASLNPFGSGSVANAITAPDGTMTADLITENTTTNTGRLIYQTVSTTGTLTWSFYVKSYSGNRFVRVQTHSASSWFDLENGTWGTIAAGMTPSVTALPDGWYKITLTGNPALPRYAGVGPALADGSVNYTGDGTSGFYVWGASLTATEYPVAYTTTRNLLTDSQDFERGTWSKFRATVVNDATQAPDGTITADKIQETFDTGRHAFAQQFSPNLIGGVEYRFSFYAKAAGRDFVAIGSSGSIGLSDLTFFDLQNGLIGPIGSGWSNATIIDAGNGWYRCSVSGTPTTTSVATMFIFAALSETVDAQPGDGTSGIYIWGAQLEPGTVATDYVRTVDVVGKAYRWYEPTEGTLYAESTRYSNNDAFQRVAVIASALPTATFQFSILKYSGDEAGFIQGSPTVLMNKTLVLPGVLIKSVVSSGFGDHAFTVNGNTPATSSTAVSIGSGMTQMEIGALNSTTQRQNGHIRRLTYWPTRQPDATLQVITQ